MSNVAMELGVVTGELPRWPLSLAAGVEVINGKYRQVNWYHVPLTAPSSVSEPDC